MAIPGIPAQPLRRRDHRKQQVRRLIAREVQGRRTGKDVRRAVLLVLASSIVLATVVGRYHFVLDSVAGVLVGAIAWAAG